ncbi:unnamed protein product [Adineta steineri]|uniref:Uncharacterized protein n=1 Tax=Adineta steineri TaxID=433720 RepID=A0A818QLN8_9BILA|nr:unnamed protein product [Adineta steineri]CAF3640607.1 unnamed protein product [Adineta steineri]
MHNKTSDSAEYDHGNRSIRKSKSTSNLSIISKKKSNNIPPVKIEVDVDTKLENNKSSPIGNKINGNASPNHRRRPKRSSINNNCLLSTVTNVHELMSFVIYKDNPPTWLKQSDLYKEYINKSQQINAENISSGSPPHYHRQSHRKQRCNLQMYARSGQSWPSISPSPLISPIIDSRSKTRNHSNESIHKLKRETNISPIHSSSSMVDLSTPLNISIKQDPIVENSLLITNKSKSLKQQTSTITTRRQHMLCKKKTPQNGIRRRQCMNSVENQEPLENKDSSSSSEHDSNTSTASSSSIQHTSPSPTTTVSGSSSHNSSPTEYMRGNRSINTRLSSPLRIQTSISPHAQSLSTPQRRSARIWAPSNFYINPMWILPGAAVTSKRLLVQNTSSSPSPPPSESNKRPRRRCRS